MAGEIATWHGGAWVEGTGVAAPAPAPAPAPLRLPVRAATVELDGDYAGFRATMRLNPRRAVVDDLTSGDTRRCCAAIAALVLNWNFADEDGAPVPATPEGVYDLPDDLLKGVIDGYIARFNDAVAVPKASSAPSGTTSTTSA